jgi:beta-1,2-xylosyltransferase
VPLDAVNRAYQSAIELFHTRRVSDSAHTETIKKTDWEAKTIPKAFWRGSLTGAFHNDRTNWRKSQRERMCYKVKETGTQKTVLVDLGNGTTRAIPYDVETLNAHYLDVAPVGGAVQVSFGAA